MTASTVTRVVKLGGEVIRGESLPQIAKDIAALDAGDGELDARVVVVHGGGPQTTELQNALGQVPRIVAGRRITDTATLEAIKMAVVGVANVDLCGALSAAGTRPVGLHGASGGVIRAEKRPPRVFSGAGPDPIDLGHVGDVLGFDRDLIEELLSLGRIPVLACLGADPAGNVYNINADIVATRLAVEIGAADLFLVMDVPGVLANKDDPSTRLARLTVSEAKALIENGTVAGGMIPKLDESFVALAGGVERVHLLSGKLPQAAAEPGSVGTLLVA